MLAIRVPGMEVRVTQPVRQGGAYEPYLQVSVTVQRLLPYFLEGVLGSTFLTAEYGAFWNKND